MWCLCLFVLVCVASVSAYNVDTQSAVRHTGKQGSMFGFSVAEHKERGASWVLVGAPGAQTNQPGVKFGGAVYMCDINRDDCRPVPFDRNGNLNNSDGTQIDKKSYQWFGATVRSSNGVVLACAPRYVYYAKKLDRRDPVGTCYVARDQLSSFSEFSPCRTQSNWGYHRQGSCQAGLGADISRDGRRLFIGAVGSYYWQGQLHSIDSVARLPFLPPRYTIYHEGQLFSQNTHSRPEVISTNQSEPIEDDSYLGYSVTAGDFSGNGGQNDVALGMPRGAELKGKIVLYTWNAINLENITGEQMGSYFGYSLATADMNGDKLDDLVIGAPLYTDLSNNEGAYETGKIYVVYQEQGTHKFRSVHEREGFKSKSRFGLALCSLADINKDGYGDVAVGAPYDGPNERGIVYIFHGSANGIREKPSQIITTEDIGYPITTFGFSLAGGVDLDGNEYPDVVVGAYESDTSVFLKARPVVKMKASISFQAEQKQIVLEERNCTLKDYTKVACMSLHACLQYEGFGVDENLNFEVQVVLDSKKTKSPRMFFLSEEGRFAKNQTLMLTKEEQKCITMLVYIEPNIRDKLTSLEAELRYGLYGSDSTQSVSSQRRYYRSLTPVLDLNEPLVRKDSISIQKNCGKDNICIPDLRLIVVPSVKRYLLGSGERLVIEVIAQNEGEDAFESTFEMQVPAGVNYINIERVDQEIPVHIISAPSFLNNNTLICDIGNPLPKEKVVNFKVLLQPFHREGIKPRYEFLMSLNSTNAESNRTRSDNIHHLTIPIFVETDLILQGSSHPSEVHYNTTLYTSENIQHESEIGPQVVHIYSIRNKGPSDIVEAEAHFLWPSRTLAGDNLLYLLEQPETSGPIKCDFVKEANALLLKLDRKKKSYLESSGVGFQSRLSSSGSGITIEESSSSSGSRSSVTYSGKESSHSSGRVFTAEERRKFEEAERRREEEEARAETGDGSLRYSKRVKEAQFRSQGNGEIGAGNANWDKGTNSGGRSSSREKIEGGTGRVEDTNSGRGTKIIERGRVEVSGARPGQKKEFETKLEEDYFKSYGSSQSQSGRRYGGANVEPGVGVSVNRGRYGGNDRRVETSQRRQGSNVEASGGRRTQSESERRNQESHYGGGRQVGGGALNHTYSRQNHTSTNTTWSSETGGKPVTHTATSWIIDEDGIVRNGSTSNVYEGEANYGRSSGYDTSRSSHRGSATTQNAGGSEYDARVSAQDSRWYEQSSGSQQRGSAQDTRGYEHSSGFQQGGSSQDTRRYEQASESQQGNTRHYDSDSSRQQGGYSGLSTISQGSRGGGNTYDLNIQGNRDAGRSQSAGSSSFDSLAAVALGPRDGVARTYTFDVNADKNEDRHRTSGSQMNTSRSSGSKHYSSAAFDTGRDEEYDSYDDNDQGQGKDNIGRDNVDYDNVDRSGYSSSSRWSMATRTSGGNVRNKDVHRPSSHVDGDYSGGHVRTRTYQESHAEENRLEEPYEDHNSKLKLYPRYRRQVENGQEDLGKSLQCGPTSCTRIKCMIGPLTKDQEAGIAFRSRVWVQTLKKFAYNPEVQLSSLVGGKVTKLPHIGTPDQTSIHTHEIMTQVLPRETGVKPEVVPLWVVVVSACAGAIILMLLIYLLYKCGFFKRNRPTNVPEKEPLNRNGHYQSGDEAL